MIKNETKTEDILRMLGVSVVYPSAMHPEFGTFAEALFNAIRDCNVDVQVLAPYSKTRMLVEKLNTKGRVSSRESLIPLVYAPGYWSVSTRLLPWQSLGSKLNGYSIRRAIERGFPWGAAKIDFVLSYFFDAGKGCLDICEKFHIPCFVELGESTFSALERELSDGEFNKSLSRFSGIIAVSRNNEEYIRSRCPNIGERLIHLPNSVNTDIFKPNDRLESRKKLGLAESDLIAVFCGHFVERKGPLRVLRALDILGDVKGVFLGRGPQMPVGEKVLHCGPVENSMIPLWLSACDVFVLPSLAEGMCVAIIEALACGLPVVVSDRSFNRSFLSEECAVFVDPTDPYSIADGINYLRKDTEKYHLMSKSAAKVGKSFSLETRVKKLLSFIDNIISENKGDSENNQRQIQKWG